MNLHASVLLLNVAFLLSPVLARAGAACTALAAILHFALLSCLTWMAIEGFNLYLLLVRVYNIYIRRYMLKLCAVGWGKQSLPPLLLPEGSSHTGSLPSPALLFLLFLIKATMSTDHHPCQRSPLLSTLLFLPSVLLPNLHGDLHPNTSIPSTPTPPSPPLL